MWRLVPALVAEMGQAYPELLRAAGADHRDAPAGGEPFQGHPRPAASSCWTRRRPSCPPAPPFPGETAFRLYDTFGFPARSDRGRAQGPRHHRRRRRLRRRHGAPARRGPQGLGRLGRGRHRGAVVRTAREGRRHRIPRLHHRGRRGQGRRPGRERRPRRGGPARRTGDAGGQPDAVLRRIRRPGRRHRPIIVGRRQGPAGGQRHPKKRWRSASSMSARVEGGPIAVGDDARFRRRRASAAPPSAPTTRPPICCMRRCAAPRRRTSPRRARWWRPERLRFDISHPKALSPDEIRAAERAVNRRIRANCEVATKIMTPKSAIEAGAMALFGEKYGDEVRVVSMGGDCLGRAVRRHPCAPHRRHRRAQDHRRKRRRRRACAASRR